jgi:hypothetical protein
MLLRFGVHLLGGAQARFNLGCDGVFFLGAVVERERRGGRLSVATRSTRLMRVGNLTGVVSGR